MDDFASCVQCVSGSRQIGQRMGTGELSGVLQLDSV